MQQSKKTRHNADTCSAARADTHLTADLRRDTRDVVTAALCKKHLINTITLHDLLVSTKVTNRTAHTNNVRAPENHHLRVVHVLVDTHDEHGRVGRRRGDDHLLTASVDVQLRLLQRREHPGRLDHVVNADLAPRNLVRLLSVAVFMCMHIASK